MKNKSRNSVLLSVVLIVIYIINISYSSGPPTNAVTTGCTCHGVANANTFVSINFNNGAGLQYNNNQTYPIAITISSQANKPGAGFIMSYNIGSLTPVSSGTQITSGVWMHSTPKAMTGINPTTTTWIANWTAPATGNTPLQLKAAGNAVSLSSGSSLDQWNFASSINIALPVFFESFNVYQLNESIEVRWEVLNEKNMSNYEIQNSTDGIVFTTIKNFLPDNNESKHAYTWTDNNTNKNSKIYYRILAKDVNGNNYYSIIQSVSYKKTDSLKIYPNVISAGSGFYLLSDNLNINNDLQIYNHIGQLVLKTKIINNKQFIDIPNLSNGLYFISLSDNNSFNYLNKLIVQ